MGLTTLKRHHRPSPSSQNMSETPQETSPETATPSEGAVPVNVAADPSAGAPVDGAPSTETPGTTTEAAQVAPVEAAPTPEAAAPDAPIPEAAAQTSGNRPAKKKKKKKAPVKTSPYTEALKKAQRNHGFSPGEIVAGRLLRTDAHWAWVDLFGKATAVIPLTDPLTPQDIPDPTPAPVPATAPASAPATAPATAELASTGPESPAAQPENATSDAEAPAPEAQLAEAQLAEAQLAEVQPPETTEATAPSDEAMPEGSETVTAEEAVVVPPAPEPLPLEETIASLQPGAVVRGRVVATAESGQIMLINRYQPPQDIRARIKAQHRAKQRIQGLVFGFNRGGFDVWFEGVRAFCPVSGMFLEGTGSPEEWVNQSLEFSIVEAKEKGDVVLGRRSILERERRKARKKVLKTLEVGQVVEGRVTQVREYGLFVDIGEGVEALLHQSELAWSRGVRPGDVAIPGATLTAKIISIETPEREPAPESPKGAEASAPDAPEDEASADENAPEASQVSGDEQSTSTGAPAKKKRRRSKNLPTRVSLSLKALQDHPWEKHKELLRPGRPVMGTVVSTTDFGAFVRVAPGLEGLLHINELGSNLKHADQATKSGERLLVIIERCDRKQERIALSKARPWEVKAFDELLVEQQTTEQQVAAQEVATQEVAAQESSAQESSAQETPVAEEATEDAPVRAAPLEEAAPPGEAAPLEETEASVDAPVVQATSEATPSSETPEEAPVTALAWKPGPPPPKPGSHVKVKVVKTESKGMHLQVLGVWGRRGRGFLPSREMPKPGEGAKGAPKASQKPPSLGDELHVKVVAVERDGTLKCSLRAREMDEERSAVRDYKKESAKQGFGTFGDLLKAKL